MSEMMRMRVLIVGESGDDDGLGGIVMMESMLMMPSYGLMDDEIFCFGFRRGGAVL